MSNIICKTNHLTKQYKDTRALNGVSIEMHPGKIYGLIGQNGAGKTTLMRILAGLAFPTEGTIELFGTQKTKELERQRRRIGCMIEYPGLLYNLNAFENLKYQRIMRGIPGKGLEEELLKLVGLEDAGKKKTKDFSLGMKQRLGIAIAMLGSPEFLILDEPVNGLDPVGVVEIRSLIKSLSKERSITVLISSHNLPELHQTATDYIIIHHGEIKRTLSQDELSEKCRHHLRIQCEDPQKLAAVLVDTLGTTNFTVMPDKTIRLYDHVDEKKIVMQTLFNNGILPLDFKVQGETLENYFLSVIGGEPHV